MGRLMKKYPDDLEAASLYAVALLGTCQFERQYAMYMRAASAAEEVYAKNPQHPGASQFRQAENIGVTGWHSTDLLA